MKYVSGKINEEMNMLNREDIGWDLKAQCADSTIENKIDYDWTIQYEDYTDGIQCNYVSTTPSSTEWHLIRPQGETIERLAKLVELMYEKLGVPINNPDGSTRDIDDIACDMHSLNTKTTLTFQELMQF